MVMYTLVFVLLTGFAVLTVASFSLVNASRRAYRRAALDQARAMSKRNVVQPFVARLNQHSKPDEAAFAILTSTTQQLGIDIHQARKIASQPKLTDRFVAVPLPPPGPETYLVFNLDPTTPMSIAFVEISRMVPLVIIAALACAAILSFLINRLLLPSLDALGEVARKTRDYPEEGLVPSGAPNEIMEVARRFRTTVRLLNQERELVESQKNELERVQDQLIRASKLASVGRLAAGIAHEIGNPLAAVQGYLSLLKDGLPEQQRVEALERSLKEMNRIHGTIRKLLAYARPGESSQEPITPLSTKQVVEDALALVRGHPALKQVEVECHLPESTEPNAEGHVHRLGQVLVNLLLNAAQAMTTQSAAPKITIAHKATNDSILLEIQDNGPGVPHEHLDAIFDPFFTTKDPGEGTGLGLAVSRASMEAMGGDLTVQSTTAGACFIVRVRKLPHASDSQVS